MDDNLKKVYILEVFNSLAWFSMDALWMLEYERLAYLFGIPTVVTGVLTIVYSRNSVDKGINYTILFWILMNISWLLSDLYPWVKENHICLAFFFFALTSIFVTFVISDYSIEAFHKLRRFRLIRVTTKEFPNNIKS